jgi:two-component system, response regulator YesN
MKGYIFMSDYKSSIEKICKFIFSLSNIDTLFIDSSSNIQLEYGHTQVPAPLKPYWKEITDQLGLQDYNSQEAAFIHLTSYLTNFISVKVSKDSEYLGSIVVGPYLTKEPDILMIESMIFENKLSISLKNVINQYYLSLPLLSTYKAKLIAESLSFSVHNLNSMESFSKSIVEKTYRVKTETMVSPDTVMQNTKETIEMIEKRYIKENELLHAVEMGNIEKLETLSEESFFLFRDMPNRVPNDPLRSGKNIAFVLNTLLRKAAEKGGLHPMDIHSLSEKFAVQIEQTTTIQQLADLLKKMRLDYCNAVRKLSLKDFSYLTQKAIEFIRKNFDGNLSLEGISKEIDVNLYELSRQFKKETGQNITEYINIQRVNEAIYIMKNPSISITDAAYMVGFNDLAYFTKVFKKLKGITPSEYRKNKKI